MIKLTYNPKSEALPDGLVEVRFRDLIYLNQLLEKDYVFSVEYSTENIFNYVRWMIYTDPTLINIFEFWFEGKKLNLNSKGRIEFWPNGFCDFNEKLIEKLIGWD